MSCVDSLGDLVPYFVIGWVIVSAIFQALKNAAKNKQGTPAPAPDRADAAAEARRRQTRAALEQVLAQLGMTGPKEPRSYDDTAREDTEDYDEETKAPAASFDESAREDGEDYDEETAGEDTEDYDEEAPAPGASYDEAAAAQSDEFVAPTITRRAKPILVEAVGKPAMRLDFDATVVRDAVILSEALELGRRRRA